MKKIAYAALPLAVITLLAVGSGLASADSEENLQMGQKGPKNENHMLLKEALDSNDYQTFLEVAPDKMLEVITEENFSKLVEAHNLLNEAQNYREQAQSIFEELGLERPMGDKGPKGQGGKFGKMDPEQMEAMKNAIENQDYSAWVELAPEKLKEYITEENFSQFCEARQLMRDGDQEGAKTIFDSLGLPERPQGNGMKGPKGLGQETE